MTEKEDIEKDIRTHRQQITLNHSKIQEIELENQMLTNTIAVLSFKLNKLRDMEESY